MNIQRRLVRSPLYPNSLAGEPRFCHSAGVIGEIASAVKALVAHNP